MSLRRAFGLAFVSNNGTTFIALVSSIFLARLLTPKELGVFSLGMALVGIPELLRDFGVGTYIVQEKDLTTERIRTAFGLVLLSSWIFAALFVALSWPAAAFFREPEVRDIMWLLALNMMIVPFGTVTFCYMRRQMMFGSRMMIEVGSAVVNSVVAVSFAFAGFGTSSLGWALIACTIFTVAVTTRYRPKEWSWLPSFSETRRVMSFGTRVTGASMSAYLNGASADLILGKVQGMESVALFGRAMGLRRVFEKIVMGAVTAVALPHLSRKHNEGVSLRGDFLAAGRMLSGLGWPFFTALAILAEPTIRVLYGPQWDLAVPLLQCLCLAAVIGLPFWVSAQFVLATGDAKTNLRNEIVALTVRVGVLLSAAFISLDAVAVGTIVTSAAGVAIWRTALRHHVRVGILEVYREMRTSLWPAAGAGIGALIGVVGMPLLGLGNDWVVLGVGGVASVALSMTLLMHAGHPLAAEIRRTVSTVKDRKRGSGGSEMR
ncbi:MAG: oligosaccharide flippase family protein [Betaproteobacteria bacterium]|nr:oligosaccharide flippase family protein [Betaproteobacteria bacterium]